MNSKIVWIASYPKSGNTWLRFLVCNLAFGPVESAADLARFSPDLHELPESAGPPDQPTLMKTHFPYGTALRFAEHTAGAIQVVRDPADVMLSNFHYGKRSGASANEDPAALDRYVDAFIGARGDPRWIKLGMGSWEDNVRSWSAEPREFPVVRIRYEDMQADGVAVAGVLCRCLGLARNAAQIAKAVAASSFERMRQIEEADIAARRIGIFYKPYLQQPIDSGLRFMRSGTSGAAAVALSQHQRQRLDAAFGTLRRELGYPAI